MNVNCCQSTMKVKVILGHDIRIWRYFRSESKLSTLSEFINSTFDLNSKFWLQYSDDEGDRLTLSSQLDFQEALSCAFQEQRKSLKIYVIPGTITDAQKKYKQSHSSQTSQTSQISQIRQKKQISEMKQVHCGVSCNNCNCQPICGVRYKCSICSDFDLCSECEKNGAHDSSHALIKIANANYAKNTEKNWKSNALHGLHEFAQSHHSSHHYSPYSSHHYRRGVRNYNQSNPWRRSAPLTSHNNKCTKSVKPLKVSADFVCDVTLPDRSYYPMDTVLTKTWKMKNSGDVEWGNVELVFFKGNESLSLEKRYPVLNAKCGECVEISAVIKTPKKEGRYCSYYRLQRNGEFFGPRVWVDIFTKKQCKLNKMRDKEIKKIAKCAAKIDRKMEKLEKKKMAILNSNKCVSPVSENVMIEQIADAAIADIERDAIECVCGAYLLKSKAMNVLKCDVCNECIVRNKWVYHCPLKNNSKLHPMGLRMCNTCVEYQRHSFEKLAIQEMELNKFKYENELLQLKNMGFDNDGVIKERLIANKGNVQRVANSLLLQ